MTGADESARQGAAEAEPIASEELARLLVGIVDDKLGEDMVALASEEMAIRAIINHEIDTYDPYESEVLVWTR